MERNRSCSIALKKRFLLIAVGSTLIMGKFAAANLNTISNDLLIPYSKSIITLDGKLTEWTNASVIPIRSKACITNNRRKDGWKGPRDASMNTYWQWDSTGLYIAALVQDNDVRNKQDTSEIYREDCLEFFLDGRSDSLQFKIPYSPGAFQVLLTPPLKGKGIRIEVSKKLYGVIEGIKAEGQLTKTGYQSEIFIPWKAFNRRTTIPSQIGLGTTLDDYDSLDGNLSKPIEVSSKGLQNLFKSPNRLLKGKLVTDLNNSYSWNNISIDLPPLLIEKTIKGTLILGRNNALSSQAKVMVSLFADSLKPLSTYSTSLLPSTYPWTGDKEISFILNVPSGLTQEILHGKITIKDGKQEFTHTIPIRNISFVKDNIAALRKINFDTITKSDPFKAIQYIGAFTTLTKYNQSINEQNYSFAHFFAQELQTRLSLLENKFYNYYYPILSYLQLSKNPDAQVVVEYPYEGGDTSFNRANVNIYWGALPIANFSIKEFKNKEELKNHLANKNTTGLQDLSVKTKMNGYDAVTNTKRYETDNIVFSPERLKGSICILSVPKKQLLVISPEDSSLIKPEAVYFTDTNSNCKAKAQTVSKRFNIPIISKEQLASKQWVYLTGPIDSIHIPFQVHKWARSVKVTPSRGYYAVAIGNKLLEMINADEKVVQHCIEMVKDCQPVTSDKVDAIRKLIVGRLDKNYKTKSINEKLSIYCGDVHMHSNVSDGKYVPIGIVLQSMYNYMDFAVLSDHNQIRGAVDISKFFDSQKISPYLIIGQEITTPWYHMNAYPVQDTISRHLGIYDVVKQAHAQGAVIQWNHPGYPPTDSLWIKEHLETGISGTGIDAWEHIPDYYQNWLQNSNLPVLTGSTDNHSTTFYNPERTVIYAQTPKGNDIAESVRWGYSCIVDNSKDQLFYGHLPMTTTVFYALREGKNLKSQKATLIAETLKNLSGKSLVDKITTN